VEKDAIYASFVSAQHAVPEKTAADAIATAAREITDTLDAAAIVAWTFSGSTPLRIARERSSAPLIALTPNQQTARRLVLAWGVHAVITDDARDVDDMTERASRIAREEGFAMHGDRIVIIVGIPFGTPGATNLIRLARI